MNNLSSVPSGASPHEKEFLASSHRPPKGVARILHVWYLLTSPPEPPASAPFHEKDLFRRGRTGSQISIILYLLLFVSYPAAFAGSNSYLIAILTIDIFLLSLAMMLNRLKRVAIAGIIVVLCFLASPTTNILTTPGGINTSALPVFGLLILPVMCAVSFLPPAWVFVVAAINSLFAFYALRFLPNSGELHQVLQVAFPGIITPILLGQWIVATVAFLWVRGAREAILRADRAEEITRLRALEIQRQEEQLESQRQIERGMQEIITTIGAVVTRNDLALRVSLGQDNILWRASTAINNLLARLQGLKHSQEELQKTHAIAAQVTECMRNNEPIPLKNWTQTSLDPIIMEYNRLAQKNTSNPH